MIVEDDEVIAKVIAEQLSAWGYEPYILTDFTSVTAQFASINPQLVLMDISLPFFNGYRWCSEIRRISRVPVIFISSASDRMNIVMAVNMGGDDFIAKPFDMDVLVAKVQALLRRTYEFGSGGSFLEHHGAILNTEDGVLTHGESRISLTKNEIKILSELMQNKGKIVTRDELMERLWQTDCYIDENTLNVNVARLRRKLTEAGLDGFITTKKGLGYMIE
jgi:DNA-binding response OmpR family regulator